MASVELGERWSAVIAINYFRIVLVKSMDTAATQDDRGDHQDQHHHQHPAVKIKLPFRTEDHP
jgi:hypothetical protein